ncbi:CsbD family protein [Streptomyces sp. NPDC049585]|uniref:CsbD family protein n=1 Tax=Streptomyces sp. NPDC049585 TaxID=3155154 RepID=UPI003422DB69
MTAKDKAKAKAERAKGRLKQSTGKATGDRRMEAEGRVEKAKGELHDAVEKARHAVRRKGGH